MNIQRDTEYRFGELVLSPEYSNEQGVVVMIKSLATGQTMRVYLDEPTLEVDGGINLTYYEGHFYEEEFMVTFSDGFEVTGLPLMYPYFDGFSSSIVIDVENNSVIFRNSEMTGSMNLVSSPIYVPLIDSQYPDDTSRNAVDYTFIPFGGTSPGLEPEEPVIPIDPGEGGGEVFVPAT